MMTVKRHITRCIAGLIAPLCLAVSAHAAPSDAHSFVAPIGVSLFEIAAEPDTLITKFAQSTISASKAKSIARKRVPGAEVVDISRKGGRYRVRMIRKDGRVVDIIIDAGTGRVLN